MKRKAKLTVGIVAGTAAAQIAEAAVAFHEDCGLMINYFTQEDFL